jgi:hypothetical protein
MIPTAPQIGFDRFIQLDWVTAALKVRAGVASLDELNELLDAAGLGNEAKIKTRTKLNALVLEPRADLVDFIVAASNIFSGAKPQQDAAGFAWGSALANVPVLRKGRRVHRPADRHARRLLDAGSTPQNERVVWRAGQHQDGHPRCHSDAGGLGRDTSRHQRQSH